MTVRSLQEAPESEHLGPGTPSSSAPAVRELTAAGCDDAAGIYAPANRYKSLDGMKTGLLATSPASASTPCGLIRKPTSAMGITSGTAVLLMRYFSSPPRASSLHPAS